MTIERLKSNLSEGNILMKINEVDEASQSFRVRSVLIS